MRNRERQEEHAAGPYDNQMIEMESSVYRCITNSSRQQIAVWNIGLYGDGGHETHFPQKTENVSPGVMSRSSYFSSNSLWSGPGHCLDLLLSAGSFLRWQHRCCFIMTDFSFYCYQSCGPPLPDVNDSLMQWQQCDQMMFCSVLFKERKWSKSLWSAQQSVFAWSQQYS